MSQSAQVPGGVVSHLQGRADLIPAGEKNARPLAQGDTIQPGDVILAQADTEIKVTDSQGNDWLPKDMQVAMAEANDKGDDRTQKAHHPKHTGSARLHLDDTINAVNKGDDDAAPAGGLAGGGGGSMSPGLRIDRVIETVTPQEFAYSSTDREVSSPLSSVASPASASVLEPAGNQAPHIDEPGNPNYAPSTGHYTLTTEEDKPLSGQVKATDPDGDTLSYNKGADPAHGSVTVNADGTWTYTPAKDFNGSDSFSVVVSDGKGGVTTAVVDIGVTPVNDAPKVVDSGDGNYDPVTGHYSAVTDEDTPVSGQVKGTDVDGDTLSYSKRSDPSHGTVVVNEDDGTWTYTPAKDFNGSDSFTISIDDGHGGTTTATIDIGISPVNDAPKIVDPGNEQFDPITGHYNLTTDEDTPVSGLVKATDADGDALTFAKGSDPAHGTVVVNDDGTWTYTPAKDFNGADSFTVTVSDGHGGKATTTIDIGVNEGNDVPKVVDPGNEDFNPITGQYSLNTDEDTPVSGQVKATDADGDALTFAKGSDPAHGTVVVNDDGTWTYTPAKDFNGADSFTVTVSDGQGGSATATVNIGVDPVNDAPKITDPGNDDLDPITGHYSLTTDEDTPVSGQVRATDADGDALTFAKGSDPAHGTVVVNDDGTWTYTPAKDFNGADSFTVTVSDGQGGTTTATIDIGVNAINDAPKVVDSGDGNFDPVTGHYTLGTDEDKPVSGAVKATDADGDALTFAKGSDPAHGTVVVNDDGTWTYTPAQDYNGGDSFTVIVSDGQGGTATATIDIDVGINNDPPKIVDPGDGNYDPSTGHYAVSTDEDTPVSGAVQATDADGDPLSYAKGSDPAHGTVVVNDDGTWTYTPAKDFNGTDSFTVTVSDGQGGTTTAIIDVGVNAVNDAPKVVDSGDGNFDPITGHYTLTTDEDTPVSGQVKATDADGDALSYAKGSDPAHGTVVIGADGSWTYTPSKDFNGADSFTVTVSDGHGGSTTATIDIGVNAINDAPKLVEAGSGNFDPSTGHYAVTTDEDKPVSGAVKATDADGDPLTYAKGSDPAHGSVTVNGDGTWTYTPAKDYNGADSFTVTVSDGQGGTATATIDIGIKPVNDAPKLTDPDNGNFDPSTGHYHLSTDEDKPVSGQVKAIDADGDALTFAKGADPAHGSVIVNADGTWTYTPAKDYNGADSFTVKVSDGQGGTTTATIDIGINPVNDAPVIGQQSARANVSEEALAGGNADTQGTADTGNAREATGRIPVSDAEGDHITLTLSGPGGLTSGGTAITWSGSGTASDPLVGSAGSRPILTATIDDQGRYKITLQGPVDHADPTVEDVRSINLQVQANDGHSTSTSALTISVEDDSPLGGAQTMTVNATTGTQNTNLMLIIDTSKSMSDTLADKTANGIKAAINSLIDRYDGIGDVKVQIVTFNDAGQGRASWMTVAQAKTFVAALTADGSTNYDAALAAAKASFVNPGKLADGVNVSYFITDGQPSKGHALDSNDENTWEKFLHDNHIDSYAIGTGTLTAQYISNIEPIAYNGISNTEQPATTLKTNQELTKYLLDTVPTLKSGSLASLAGADGLKQIEAFSSSKQVSSSLDASTKIMTITLQSGAEVKLNTVTGEFTMKQGPGGGDETFQYTIVDKDGDRGTGTVTLHAPGDGTSTPEPTINHAPIVYAANDGHNILDLVDLTVNPLLNLTKTQHVAVQDVDNNLVRVDITVDQLISIGSLLGDHSKLSVSTDAALTHGLHITGQDSRHLVIESDTPGHTIDVTQVNHLLSTLSYDPAHIFNTVSVDLFPHMTIKATDALGASDSKSVSSSIVAVDVQVPLLADNHVAASSDHALTGDSDVFAWTLADKPATGDHHVDTICDFNGAAPSAGGDVLDLRDLLHVDSGPSAGTNSVDKLLNFLDFDTQSQPGNTVIHVSSNGGFQADAASGHSDSSGCADQQHIVLANVDIRNSLGLDSHANDHQIIAELVQRGKLLVDNC